MSAGSPHAENLELLAAIIANPDEDTPRLIYADWLQENDQPKRAEFIRLHIEWERRPLDAPPDDDLKRRLVSAWEATIRPPDRDTTNPRNWEMLHPRGTFCSYERGFCSTAEIDYESDEFTKTAQSVFRSAPIRVMYLVEYANGPLEEQPDWRERFREAATFAKGVTGFGMELPRGSSELVDQWDEYIRSPQAGELRLLDFNYSAGDDACPLVVGLSHLTKLLVLDLTVCCRMDDWCLWQLTSAAHLQSLIALRLGAHDEYLGSITEEGIGALTSSPYLTKLRQLVFNNHEDLNDAAIRRLLKWDHVGQLEALEVSCRSITDAGVIALARSRKLHNLRRLVLDGDQIHTDAITAILDSPHLRGLNELYLSPLTDQRSFKSELQHRLMARFPNYAKMATDPPAVCVEDRIRARYRLMTHPGGDGDYRGRGEAYSRDPMPNRVLLHPEYAIL